MGPRSIDRGKVASRSPDFMGSFRLQWGRDQLIAESKELKTKKYAAVELQWGRDQLIAESLSPSTDNTEVPVMLQWGRDQLIAERSFDIGRP